MRKMYRYVIALLLMSGTLKSFGQNSEDVLNLLIKQNLISQEVVDSLRADAAIKAQDAAAKQKFFNLLTSRNMTLNGYTQVRFESFQEAGKPDYMDVRRVRLDLKGNIVPTWDYRLQLDFATSPKILDAIIGYKPCDALRIQAGQFKIPLSLENLTPSNKMDFIERSQVVEALVARSKDILGNHNGRDIGLQFSGSVVKLKNRFLADYYLGFFNGQGINRIDSNEMKDIAGRLVLHVLNGLDIGAAYYSGYDVISKKNTVRNRAGLELSYIWKNLSVKGEYLIGTDHPVTAEKATERGGYYGQVGYYLWKRRIQPVFKYDFYDPNTSSDSKNDASTVYVYGVNIFFNDFTKLYINYGNRIEEGGSEKKINNDIIEAQIQIGF